MPRGNFSNAMGQGQGRGSAGSGQGVASGRRPGMGPGGECICPVCQARVPHQPGNPCSQMKCPKCDNQMTRG